MQTNNSFEIGDLVGMQLALDEDVSGIVVHVDMQRYDYEFPPIKIHWFDGTVAGLGATWQNPDEIELVSRG